MPTQPWSGQNIPPRQYTASYPTPIVGNKELITALESNLTDYLAVVYGTPPPNGEEPDMMLAKQTPVNWPLVQRLYARDLTGEIVYNYNESFTEESASYPVFVRDFIVRRSAFEASTRLQPMSGMYLAVVTDGGSGYNPATTTVTLSSGTGAITPVISAGVVTHLAITATGTYGTAPLITITDASGAGVGATGVAYVQPQTALLVKEEMIRLGPESERDSLWVLVRRVYEILPGPRIVRKGYDLETKAAVRTTKRRVVPTTEPTALETSEVFNAITMYCKDSSVVPIDDLGTTVAYLTETFMELPTAVLTVWDQDEETLVNIKTTYEVVLLSSITAPATHTTGIIISYKKIDGTTALKIIRDYTEFLDFEYTEQRFAGGSFPDLWDYANFFWTNGCGSFNHERSQFSDYVRTRVTIYFTAAVQEIIGLTIQPNTIQLGHAVNQVNVLNDAGSIIYAETDCTGIVTFPASDPSYTDYIDTIQGTYQLRSGESALWKALIWRNMEVEIWML